MFQDRDNITELHSLQTGNRIICLAALDSGKVFQFVMNTENKRIETKLMDVGTIASSIHSIYHISTKTGIATNIADGTLSSTIIGSHNRYLISSDRQLKIVDSDTGNTGYYLVK